MSELTKQQLRKQFKDIRLSQTPKEKSDIEQKVYRFFVESDDFDKFSDILVYVSSDIEIGTKKIMEHILCDIRTGHKKRLLCPRCENGTNIMHFYRIDSLDNLETGSFGILEPKEHCELVDKFIDPVCIVPALSFDSKGYRLGFGKGFYDRFLADFNGITIGLCCESCMTDGELPRDEHDISVDHIVTERGWVKTQHKEYNGKEVK